MVPGTKRGSDQVEEQESASSDSTEPEIQQEDSEYQSRRELIDSAARKATVKQLVDKVPAYLKFKQVEMNVDCRAIDVHIN